MVVGKVVAHLCLTLIIWKKFNNDKRRKDMVVGKVVAHLCLTLIIKVLKFSVEYDRVVTTLTTIKH
jgi:ABC-type transport system involved in cytochrome c biogenesis permease component